ncbi:oligosaccharide flippase family protein [Paenibacillus sp. FSL K6-0276]|uniref:oligosaccharide flippase family protein n=1 Tax=Paenibacillus sp. FSL K6-0276 TaxID=2921450 RepID=UPI0030EEEDB4
MFGKLNIKRFLYSNVTKLATGTLISQLINISFSPLLSRLFTPEDFGVSVFFQSISSILLAVCTLKLDSAIIVSKSEEKAKKLVVISLFYTTLFAILMYFLMLILNKTDIHLFNSGSNIVLLTLLLLSILLGGSNSTFTNLANRKMDYRVMMWIPIINTLSATCLNIILGLAGITGYGLIYGMILGQLISTIVLIRIYRIPKIKPEIIKTTKEFSDFPLYQMPAILLNTISVQFPIFAFSYYFNDSVTGWYSMSQRVLLLPLTIIGSAIAQVYFRKAAILYNNNESLYSLTKKLLTNSFIIAFIPMLIILSAGDKIFGIVFGNEWVEAGNIARYLVPWFLMVFVASPLSNVLIVLKKQKQNLIMNVIMLFTRLIAIGIGATVFTDYKSTILLFGIVGFFLWYMFSIYIANLTGIKVWTYLYKSIAFFTLLFVISYFFRIMLL